MDKINLAQDPVPDRRVNVYLTREDAFSIDRMFEITKKVLGRLGCDGCHSGRQIDFHIIEDFVVNPSTKELQDLPGRRF
jgi:hypothetical protein